MGPWGKGIVDDIIIKALTPEASACHDLSCCGIEGCDIELLIKGAEWEALGHIFVLELSIIADYGCSGNTGLCLRCDAGSSRYLWGKRLRKISSYKCQAQSHNCKVDRCLALHLGARDSLPSTISKA